MSAPEGFKLPTLGEGTNHSGVLKAVSGSVGTQSARFFVHRIYDPVESKKQQKEVFKPFEMCAFSNDKLSEYVCRVKDLSPEQQLATQGLYERFKSQSESNETSVEIWEALTQSEKVRLLQAGVLTVEQIAAHQDHELYKLGVGGKDLRDKARWHVKGKTPAEVNNDEMLAVIAENKKNKERLESMEEELYKMQALLAEKDSKKKKGKELDSASA